MKWRQVYKYLVNLKCSKKRLSAYKQRFNTSESKIVCYFM
jgi:hypothetical protein